MLARLFAGRNGIDQLNTAIFGAAVLFWIASLAVHPAGLKILFHYAMLFAAAVYCVRAMSRNISRRREENQRFLMMTGRFRNVRENWQARSVQRRQYKIFKCPSCGIKLRVPRGKGKIKVTCRQCGATFEEKS